MIQIAGCIFFNWVDLKRNHQRPVNVSIDHLTAQEDPCWHWEILEIQARCGWKGWACSELSPFSTEKQQFLQGNRTWDDVIRHHSHKNEQRSWRFRCLDVLGGISRFNQHFPSGIEFKWWKCLIWRTWKWVGLLKCWFTHLQTAFFQNTIRVCYPNDSIQNRQATRLLPPWKLRCQWTVSIFNGVYIFKCFFFPCSFLSFPEYYLLKWWLLWTFFLNVYLPVGFVNILSFINPSIWLEKMGPIGVEKIDGCNLGGAQAE